MKLLIAMSISAIMLAYTVTAHAKEASNDLAQANNPIANMVALSLHNYYIGEFTGTEDDGNQFWLRYAQPFSLGESNWLMRASLPLNTFPFGSDGSSKTGLGDLSILTAYLIDVGNPGISFGVGPMFTALTSSLKKRPFKSRDFWQNTTLTEEVFCHEDDEVYRGTDSVCAAAVRNWNKSG